MSVDRTIGPTLVFKIALKMFGKIASHTMKFALSWLCYLSDVTPDAILGNGE